MKKLFKFSFVGAMAAFAVISLLGLVLVMVAFKNLPDVEELVESYESSVPTTIYDSNEKVVDTISKEMRKMVTMDEIPEHVKNAFVAIEDKRFYKHPGVDPIRLGKAVLVNLSQARIAQGGSTITQQLAKNAFLSNEKKIMRKVKEVLIALEIEKKFSKDQILEKYINEIYFGSGFYGIQKASESIFGKRVSELNLSEAALLAGIPNRPSYYDPRKNLENAVKRSRLVLKQMKKQNLISHKEYEKAMKHKFIEEQDLTKNFKENNFTSVIKQKGSRDHLKSPEFTDIIEKKLFELFDESTVYEGGLQVYTSLDLEMQKIALKTFDEYQPFRNNSKLQGALITIDSSNGYVKSIVGGKNFKDGNFNRAINAKRQAGSTFKPFVYYTALEKGIPMNAVREDSETEFGEWKPQNYSKNFVGDVTLLEAMENSINIVVIKLLKEIGIEKVNKTVKKTGAQMEVPKDLTAALGTVATSPYELATAYIPFSNGGYKIKPVFITKILNKKGDIIYESPVKVEKIFKSMDVSLLVHMMKNVVSNGSGKTAKVKDLRGNPIEQGGKTGTTNDFRSAWYAGITPEYVTTLYIGHDDNSPMPAGSTGGSLAAPLWKKYYQKMIDKGIYNPQKFKFMEDHIKKGELILVDIDSRTGFAGKPTIGSKRTGLFKRGNEPKKEEGKNLLKLKKIFKKDTEILSEETEEEILEEDAKDTEVIVEELEEDKVETLVEEIEEIEDIEIEEESDAEILSEEGGSIEEGEETKDIIDEELEEADSEFLEEEVEVVDKEAV